MRPRRLRGYGTTYGGPPKPLKGMKIKTDFGG
jgi:hypothetical protein